MAVAMMLSSVVSVLDDGDGALGAALGPAPGERLVLVGDVQDASAGRVVALVVGGVHGRRERVAAPVPRAQLRVDRGADHATCSGSHTSWTFFIVRSCVHSNSGAVPGLSENS